jgi:chromosomal replication initiator protein
VDGAQNAVFVHGASGTGKTHLLHAIEHELRSRRPEASVVRTTADDLINSLMTAIRQDEVPTFRTYLNAIDVLLLDHLHVDGRKARTYEELDLTLAALVDHGAQVFVAASEAPVAMRRVGERFSVVEVRCR